MNNEQIFQCPVCKGMKALTAPVFGWSYHIQCDLCHDKGAIVGEAAYRGILFQLKIGVPADNSNYIFRAPKVPSLLIKY